MVELCVSVMNISTNDFHWYVNTQQIAWTKYIYIVYIVYPYNRSNVTESPVRLYWPFLVTIYKIEPLLCCLSREKHYRNTISFYMIEMKHFQRLKWNISKCCKEIFICGLCWHRYERAMFVLFFPEIVIITGTMLEPQWWVRW